MKERAHFGEWASTEAETRFRAKEDELWDEFGGGRPPSLDVPTAFGTTRAYRWEGDGEPVLFLHGATGTSLSWVPHVALLHGRVAYAVDTIGDVGGSRQTAPIREPADLVTWLDETLGGLELDRVHVAGTSYGGFLGLLLAAHRPERVRSLTLFDPGGIVRLHLFRFLAWGAACLFASALPARPRRAAGRALRMPALDDRRILAMTLYGQRHHRVRLLPTDPLSDGDLRSIAAPVLLLVGRKSEVHDARACVARASALLPDVDAELVPGAGHALTLSHAAHCTERLVGFVVEVEAGGHRSKRIAP
ncbi:MAG TPA: alpha/beta hydrolase [Acidimicrobiales bacterium]|nr:alpha/beta hydrolase [Acidimicrobiales bacterium]